MSSPVEIPFSVWRKIAMASWRQRKDPMIAATLDIDAEAGGPPPPLLPAGRRRPVGTGGRVLVKPAVLLSVPAE